jgi:DNA-binding PadR family transcriptional regulator
MRRGWDWSGFGFGVGPGGVYAWGGPRGRRRQWFGAGDMKYVILKLLRDKPRHGYEVMKELGERFHGCYSPSPGTVYPTLQWLEDEGLVTAKDVEGKKVYETTDAGRAFLDEHRDVVDDIFERVRDAVEEALGGAMGEVNDAVRRLMKVAYRGAWRSRDDAVRRRIAEALRRAAEEIEGLAGRA